MKHLRRGQYVQCFISCPHFNILVSFEIIVDCIRIIPQDASYEKYQDEWSTSLKLKNNKESVRTFISICSKNFELEGVLFVPNF